MGKMKNLCQDCFSQVQVSVTVSWAAHTLNIVLLSRDKVRKSKEIVYGEGLYNIYLALLGVLSLHVTLSYHKGLISFFHDKT